MTYNSNDLRSFTFPGFPGTLGLDAGLEIVRTKTSGVDYMSKFGHNPNIGVNEEPIWANSGVSMVYPTTAQSCTISSADTDDVATTGTGARTVYIEGLDGNYNKVSEVASLNGQNGVPLSNTYLRVYRMYVLTAGSQGENDGHVYVGYGTITTGKPANVLCSILDETNQSLQAAYTIPANKTGYIYHISGTISSVGEWTLYTREPGGVFRTRRRFTIQDFMEENLPLPIKVPEKTDIEVRGNATVAGADGTATFDILML